MAIGMMIDCARKITDSVIEYRSGREAEPRRGIQLNGATLGIMGYGAIGRYLAPLAPAMIAPCPGIKRGMDASVPTVPGLVIEIVVP